MPATTSAAGSASQGTGPITVVLPNAFTLAGMP